MGTLFGDLFVELTNGTKFQVMTDLTIDGANGGSQRHIHIPARLLE